MVGLHPRAARLGAGIPPRSSCHRPSGPRSRQGSRSPARPASPGDDATPAPVPSFSPGSLSRNLQVLRASTSRPGGAGDSSMPSPQFPGNRPMRAELGGATRQSDILNPFRWFDQSFSLLVPPREASPDAERCPEGQPGALPSASFRLFPAWSTGASTALALIGSRDGPPKPNSSPGQARPWPRCGPMPAPWGSAAGPSSQAPPLLPTHESPAGAIRCQSTVTFPSRTASAPFAPRARA